MTRSSSTNAFHGGVSGFFAWDGLEASNLPSELQGDPRLRGSDKADHAEQLAEYGFELGGPIVKDKLWFWGSYGKQDLRIQRLNQSRDKTVLEDYNAKLNFQVSAPNMLSAYWFLGEKIKLGRPNTRGLGTETPSHGRDQGGIYEDGSWPNGFLKVEDNQVFSPSFMLNVKPSHYNTGFGLVPMSSLTAFDFSSRTGYLYLANIVKLFGRLNKSTARANQSLNKRRQWYVNKKKDRN